MTNNARKFKRYLDSLDFKVNFKDDSNSGMSYIHMTDSLSNGKSITLLIAFASDDSSVTIMGGKFVNDVRSSRRDEMVRLINSLNCRSSYCKYTLDDGEIKVSSVALFNDNFDGKTIVKMMMGTIETVGNDYDRIREIM